MWWAMFIICFSHSFIFIVYLWHVLLDRGDITLATFPSRVLVERKETRIHPDLKVWWCTVWPQVWTCVKGLGGTGNKAEVTGMGPELRKPFWPTVYWKWKVKVKSLSRVRLFATPWTIAYHAPLFMGFSRQGYWSGLSFLSPTVYWWVPNHSF